MIKQLGVRYVSVKEFHLPYTLSADEASKAVAEFKKAGLTIVSGGNVSLQEEDPAAMKRYFAEYERWMLAKADGRTGFRECLRNDVEKLCAALRGKTGFEPWRCGAGWQPLVSQLAPC